MSRSSPGFGICRPAAARRVLCSIACQWRNPFLPAIETRVWVSRRLATTVKCEPRADDILDNHLSRRMRAHRCTQTPIARLRRDQNQERLARISRWRPRTNFSALKR